MVGGSIPGETKVASIAIYEAVGNDELSGRRADRAELLFRSVTPFYC